jgi:hypothetical protein
MNAATTTDRLNAELAFNAKRADHEPVTDSSLTFGDLRAIKSALVASPNKLAEILREAEPESEPNGSATLMEITVEDARKIAWALLSGKPLQTSDSYREALESIDAVGVDFGHFETAARTMQEIARKALFPAVLKESAPISDEDRIAYWKGAYERMAARNHLLFAPLNALGFGAEEKIGWRGTFPAPSTAAHFRCEFCSAEHVNCDEIPHSSECPVTLARAAFIRMQPPAGEKIRSTQDGSMEGASVTGQSPVDASSTTPPTA